MSAGHSRSDLRTSRRPRRFMRLRIASSPPVTSITTVWSYGTVDSTGTVPSVNHVSMRMNATCLSAWCTSAAIASMASRSSASSGLTIQTGPCIERR